MKWYAGLIAGAAAAVVASLISLPLESPDDLIFNTATVTAGALLAGLGAALLWSMLGASASRLSIYAGIVVAVFAAVGIAAFAGNAALDGMPGFVIPLAAIALVIAGAAVPLIASLGARRAMTYGGVAAAALAAVLGIALAGMGDEESGTLALPEASGAASSREISREDVEGITFTVVPQESELTYTVREKLASLPSSSDAVGRTRALSGIIRLDGETAVSVDLSTLASNQDRRDNFIRNNIFNETPVAGFRAGAIAGLPESYTEGQTITRTVAGSMTIRGVERPLSFEVEARLQDGTLHILARTDFTWADFDIPPPNIGGIVQVEDNVHIEVLLTARREPAF